LPWYWLSVFMKKFHSPNKAYGPIQPPTQCLPGALSPGGKSTGAWSWKNAWSCTSTPQYVFMAWYLFKTLSEHHAMTAYWGSGC
jgi:hypothetical protein